MDLLLFNLFQPSVVFHVETVIWFALQIMPGFYMESYIGRRVFITADFKLSLPKCFWGSFVNSTQNSSQNSNLFWRLCFGRRPVAHPPSNGEGLRDIQHSMSMVLDTRFHIWFIMTLYYKMRQILLQNATAILLQNATEVYYKMRQVFYYKMRQLLQNATFITNCDSTSIKEIAL